MSVTALRGSGRGLPRDARRLAVAAVALGLAALVLVLAGSALGWMEGSAPPPRNPFGTGLRETSPGATGIGGWILAVQSQFYRGLTGTLAAVRSDPGALWTLVGIGFLYGVFHAAGPGHGKAVIAGYILATKRTLLRGLGLSFSAALVQAAVAIGVVGVMTILLRATAASINATASAIESASFAALLLVGLALLWRKTAGVVSPAAAGGHAHHHHGHAHADHPHNHHGAAHHHDHGESCGCGHVHVPPAAAVERLTGWRESAGVVFAAGIRPCSGAIILLVFALSQGLFAAGVAATLAMALGTAITTGALAALAVMAKSAALRLARGRGEGGTRAVAWLEVLASAFVAALGAALLLGLWSAAQAS